MPATTPTAAPFSAPAPTRPAWPARAPAPRAWRAGAAAVAALLLAACGSSGPRPVKHYDPEAFDSTTTHTRTYGVEQGRTCEAARRALLSQGYLVTTATAEQVTARKNFQPEGEVHLEVEFRVVCANEQGGAHGSIAFATAVQERYELKKVNSSASVGVGAIGSVSLPFNASNDAMVKVASQTLTDEGFYERFFALIERFLGSPYPPESRRGPPAPPPLTEPVATPVVPASALAAQPLAAQPLPPELPASPAAAKAEPAEPAAPVSVPVPLTANRG